MNSKKNRRSSMTFGEKMIFFAGILFCLVLISTAMMGGLFARYVSTGTGSDDARVAKWGQLTITEEGSFGTHGEVAPMLIPGVDLTKKVSVSFTGSEMATYVFVQVSLSDHWTTNDNTTFTAGNGKISWAVLTGEEKWQFLQKNDDENSYIYYKSLVPNQKLESVPFVDNQGKITVSKDLTRVYVENMTGSFINIQASVIQSGGFADAAAAWAHLADK